jgi:transmembrane sensor
MEERIAFLLRQKLAQELTPAEAEELGTVLQNDQYDTIVTDVLAHLAASERQGPVIDETILRERIAAIVSLDKVQPNERSATRVYFGKAWFRYAAAVLLLVGAGGWLFYMNRTGEQKGTAGRQAKWPLIAPGGNKAILTLADGSSVVLDSAAEGLVSRQGSTKVIKPGSGRLTYDVDGTGAAGTAGGVTAGTVGYNTITTPRGGEYRIVLPDGSKVWLNAASSLHFPTAFPGRSREVEITGEAYFEIAKNADKPFSVKVNGMSVEVLGTRFNINAYGDEPEIRTSLLDGSVRVRKGQSALVVKPGEQARVPGDKENEGAIQLVKDADLNEAVAWKNGFFSFNGADIATIMRQAGRWYGVDIVYKDKLQEKFVAEIPRDVPLSRLLMLLEGTRQVHFSIEGKTVTVTR